MTFRTHLSELNVRQGRSQFPDDSMKLHIMVFSEFEGPPPFSDFNTIVPQPDGIKATVGKEHTGICRGFLRADRRQYSCYEIWV